MNNRGRNIPALFVLLSAAALAQTVSVRVEEPTGLYRRTNEVVSVRLPENTYTHAVTAPDGRSLVWQHTRDGLLFPVSLIPGELPVYRIETSTTTVEKNHYASDIRVKKIGLNRVELGNSRFRVIVDLHAAAIVEAYNLTSETHHTLNLVETTPENPDSLKNDIHTAADIPPAVPGVSGENLGWTSLGASGPLTGVEFLEMGCLRGRVRLSRPGETWEFTWTAGSPALLWKARRGFAFLSVSASPYLPFDRCVSGDEYHWPLGPEHIDPPDSGIAPRPAWAKLPGGNAVYYNHAENYGALGVVALDGGLTWTGIGSRRFLAQRDDANETTIALTFPEWDGPRTALNARRENAILRHPLLVTPAPGAPPPPVSVPRASLKPESLSLDGAWRLSTPGRAPIAVRVPGSVHTQIYPADPFSTPLPKYFTHEADWISTKIWTYSKTFTVPASFASHRLRLQFDATDYYADTYFNGHYLGRHEGYIDPYEYDVTAFAKPGASNEIAVRLWTPVSYYWRHRPYYVKGSYGAVDQKPDDITAEGITRSVRLLASAQANIADVSLDTRLLDDAGSRAEVEVNLETAGNPEGCSWQVSLRPRNFSSAATQTITAPASSARLILPVDHPQLWWTWDHGKPNLYTLDIHLLNAAGQVIDSRSLAVGIREIEKIGWDFYLNRRRMFIRGTNYYYNLFLSETSRAFYERDLNLMLQMNVNMIRLHTHFTNPEFYDLADEKGVLVWQDYLEAWYPHDTAFSLRAAALYDPLIKYVRNHPCIALWATSDEEDLDNYRDITKHLAPRPALLDPQHRPVVRSTGRYGDAHVYHGWYEGSVWEYTKMSEPFVSELGATALPNYSTIMKFLPAAWPIADHVDEWEFHKLQIPEAMRAWGSPDGMTLEQYIPQTQAYVGRLFQIALERSRRLKYNPAGGILHFHAIDIWPSATMAAIDFYRQPTQAFYTVQRSFAPVLASLEYDRDRWKPGDEFRCAVWAVNDEWRPIPNARIHWRIAGAHGLPQTSGDFPVSIAADSSTRLGEVIWKAAQPGAYSLHAQVLDGAGKQLSENIFDFQIAP